MESRAYFVAGDLVANAVVGLLSALAARAIVFETWHPTLAMGAGMALGMILAMAAAPIFVPLFGAFEVMLPTALTGMLAGMLGAMTETMHPLSGRLVGALGAGLGLAVVGWSYFVTARERQRDRAQRGVSG